MRIRFLAVATLVLATACAAEPMTTTTAALAPASTTTVATTAVPSTSAAPSTTMASTTTQPVTYRTCTADDTGLLCEAHRLILEKYVDPVDDAVLVAASAVEVDVLDEAAGGALGECVIPTTAFVPVCEAAADEGVTFANAEEAAVRGMLSALDPNSAYLDAAALAMLQQDQSGEVEGIGATVSSEDLTAADPESTPCDVVSAICRLVVISVHQGSPAEKEGLEAGDVFVAVDGMPIRGWTIDEVTSAVRGPAGTEVVLTVDRSRREIEFTITRAALFIPVVESEVVGAVGYLRLNMFTDTADQQFHEALDGLVAQGIDRLVLDLRDNPGGALYSTVRIASEFLGDGVVVKTVGPEDETVYDADEGGLLADRSLPIAVLVNRGSASASEVLSAALQERNRAILIGDNTFGKNTVQQRYGLSNGGALKLTVARWVTGEGSDFGENGVTPDIPAELGADLTVDQLVMAVSNLTGW